VKKVWESSPSGSVTRVPNVGSPVPLSGRCQRAASISTRGPIRTNAADSAARAFGGSPMSGIMHRKKTP
jgi:hypothetical protein